MGEAEKEEQARQQELQTQQMAAAQANVGKVEESWGGDEMTTDWANEPAPGLGAPGMAPKPVAYPPPVTDDWASQVPQTSDWLLMHLHPLPKQQHLLLTNGVDPPTGTKVLQCLCYSVML